MVTTVEKLTAHVDDLKQGKIDVNTGSRLMSLLRQITEEDNSKADYPTITLFADWVAHTKLDRKNARVILMEIEAALQKEAQQPGHFDNNTLMRAVSPRKLRNEIDTLLKSKNIDNTITEPATFVPIALAVVEEISSKPLELTDDLLAKRMKEDISEDKRVEVVQSVVIEPNTIPGDKSKFKIGATIFPNPPVAGMPGFKIQSAFPIATDASGKPVT
jgi:hypothetical protein